MLNKVAYQFKTKVWKHSSSASWYFVTLPKNQANEIRNFFQNMEEGWGRLPCEVKVGNTHWKSSIWFDTKHKSYILPLKAEIRKKEHIEVDKLITTIIYV